MTRGASVAVRRVRVPRGRRCCAAVSHPQGPGAVRLPARERDPEPCPQQACSPVGRSRGAEARANLRKALSRLRGCLPDERGCTGRRVGPRRGPTGRARGRRPAVRAPGRGRHAGDPGGGGRPVSRAVAAGPRGCGEEFDEWLATERRRLDEMLQQALQRLLEHYEVTGAIDRAIQGALRLPAVLQESVHRSLIRLYVSGPGGFGPGPVPPLSSSGWRASLGFEPAPETESLRAQLWQLVPAESSGRRSGAALA